MKRFNAIKCTRGSLVVEAAIFLPLFLIAILTLGCFIRQVGLEETVFHSLLTQGRFCGISAYTILNGAEDLEGIPEVAGLGSRQLFRSGLETQLEKELGMEPEAMNLESFRHLYEAHGRTDLVEAVVFFRTKIPLPSLGKSTMDGAWKLRFRAFTGRSPEEYRTVDPQDMERKDESRIVSVFPREGERYHRKDCVTITSVPSRNVLTKSILRRYDPCSLCLPGEVPLGSSIYCFDGYGEVYHGSGCRTTEKYVVEMELMDAKEKGYTPCAKCGGIGG